LFNKYNLMDTGSKMILDLIKEKGAGQLDQSDIEVLLARRSALSDVDIRSLGLEKAIEDIEAAEGLKSNVEIAIEEMARRTGEAVEEKAAAKKKK
jgi:hypothetical protein